MTVTPSLYTKPEVVSLAVFNQKGGVAKTATAINIAAYAARQGLRVLLIDTDSQGSATRSLGYEDQTARLPRLLRGEYNPPLETKIANLDLFSANLELAPLVGQSQLEPLRVLLNKAQEEGYLLCVFDCAPTLTPMQVSVLQTCNFYLVPVVPNFLALDGLVNLFKAMSRLNFLSINPLAAPLGIVFTMVQRGKIATEVQRAIRQQFPALIIEPPIPWSRQVDRANLRGLDLQGLCPSSRVTQCYNRVAKEVLRRLYLFDQI